MSFYEEQVKKYQSKYPYLDFSNSKYTGAAGLMTAVCPKHGPVTKTGKHWNANGCPKCGMERATAYDTRKYEGLRKHSKTYADDFLKKWEEYKNESPFDLSKAVFVNSITPVVVICRDHGLEFRAWPKNLVKGHVGCEICRKNRNKPKGSAYYSEKIRQVWGGKYEYVHIPEYRHEKVKAVCFEHGEYEVWLNNHLEGAGCPSCSGRESSLENEFREYVESLGLDFKSRTRAVIPPKEIDIYVPSLRIGFEIHGLHWHSEEMGAMSCRDKWGMATAAGIRLVQVFEDEWLEKKNIVKSRVASICGVSPRTYARKLKIKNIDSSVANAFHLNHHLSGPSGGINYALYDSDGLRAVLTMRKHVNHWEVMRYSSKGTVVGGFGKLFSHFIKEHIPHKVISYCDLRYGVGTVYSKNGFVLDGITTPDYFWFKKRRRYSRHGFQKHKLAKLEEFKKFYGPDKTEKEICNAAGYRRIFGVGHQRWVWTNPAFVAPMT